MKSFGSFWFRSMLAGAALTLAGGTAAADEGPAIPDLPEEAAEHASPDIPDEVGGEEGPPEDVDRADPLAQTLPSVASEVAVENAFGQRGAIERAARDLARAAAAEEAANAARELAAENAAEGRAIADEARASGAGNAEQGLDRAEAARGDNGPPDGVPAP